MDKLSIAALKVGRTAIGPDKDDVEFACIEGIDGDERDELADVVLAAAYPIIRAEVVAEVVAALRNRYDREVEGAVDFIEREITCPS